MYIHIIYTPYRTHIILTIVILSNVSMFCISEEEDEKEIEAEKAIRNIMNGFVVVCVKDLWNEPNKLSFSIN